jgi:hypothetical protein
VFVLVLWVPELCDGGGGSCEYDGDGVQMGRLRLRRLRLVYGDDHEHGGGVDDYVGASGDDVLLLTFCCLSRQTQVACLSHRRRIAHLPLSPSCSSL